MRRPVRLFQVVAYDNGYDKPVTWRIWSNQPFRRKFHLSTAHYRTREAAEHQCLKLCGLFTQES